MSILESVVSPVTASMEQPHWYAIHTKPRHEKKIAAELQEKGIPTFLPLVTEVRRWSDRHTAVHLPIFSCYVFVNMPFVAESRITVLRSYGVLSFVGNGNQGTPIPDQEIEDIRRLLAEKVGFTFHPFLRIGQKVRIRGGALDGVEGIFVRRSGKDCLVLSVQTIQRSFSISIEGYDVEPVGSLIH